jgi:small nuclear ribonucleoprotein (snRNP)-like protein
MDRCRLLNGHVVSFDRVENLLITHVSEVDFSVIAHGI